MSMEPVIKQQSLVLFLLTCRYLYCEKRETVKPNNHVVLDDDQNVLLKQGKTLCYGSGCAECAVFDACNRPTSAGFLPEIMTTSHWQK